MVRAKEETKVCRSLTTGLKNTSETEKAHKAEPQAGDVEGDTKSCQTRRNARAVEMKLQET